MTTTPPPSMIEKMARAICCPDGGCHIAELAKREGGKYITTVPCHVPGITSEARAAIAVIKPQLLAALEYIHCDPTNCISFYQNVPCDCGAQPVRDQILEIVDAALEGK